MLLKTMRKFTTLIQFFLISLFTIFSQSIAVDTITPTNSLADGKTLVSSGGSFALGFFSPTNSGNRYVGIWYNKIPACTVVWVANRQHPITDSTGISTIATNGSLIITNQNSTTIWSSPLQVISVANPVAKLLDTGNFVVRELDGVDTESFAWQSFDYPTDTLLAGMKLGWNLTSGLNRNLTAWKSSTDPSPGVYYESIDTRGDPQVFLYDGSVEFWRAGSWNGLRFTGVPETKTFYGFTFSFINNKNEVFYSFNLLNKSMLSRLVVNESGVVQRFVWLDQDSVWNLFWYAPKDECDSISKCGHYGACDPNQSPICSCLPGFKPKSPEEWNQRDGSGGCVRNTSLDCRNRTDGFVTLSNMKLPDTSNSMVDMSMNLEECIAMCLNNCSCTAHARANISGSGSGCIIWVTELIDLRVYTASGQDLYLRLAAADVGGSTLGQSHKSSGTNVVALVSAIMVAVLLVCVVCFIIWRKKTRRRRALFGSTSFTDHHNEEDASRHDLELPLYDLGTIAAATDNFSMDNKLGEGGFGPVYKGILGEGQEIAVKRLAKTSLQGIDEFKNEVMLIAKLQHRNLVRLLACCIQGEERMLIYEYMPNRSLDSFLFDKVKSALLDWKTRCHIITGIARGLLYLHQDSRFRVIHRDLKASNVLLDKEMDPKISDFGMARIFGGDEAEANTRRVVGTYGYMSPEYAMDGVFSVKSDVFSFGVLVLEIISGKKNRGVYHSESHLNLLGHAWSLWNEGQSLELVDESLGYSFPMHEAMRCIKVGLLCVQERPEDRPKMSSVVLMLGGDNASMPLPKQPGFVSRRTNFDIESSSSKNDSRTVNEVSVTTFVGR